jgi:hypothetical protein
MPIACTVCKTISAEPENIVPGSTGTEIFLWLIFLLPGIIYSIWRSNAVKDACPACHSIAIVPLQSPMGQEIQRAFPPPAPLATSTVVYGENTPHAVKHIATVFLALICHRPSVEPPEVDLHLL